MAGNCLGTVEQTFDVLQVGTRTYRNVTVTTKAKDYVFILHSKGMTNLKVQELPVEIREQLGYVDPQAKPRTNNAAAWAKQAVAQLETPQVKNVEQEFSKRLQGELADRHLQLPKIDRTFVLGVLGGLLVCHLFFSYCCMLICQKTGQQPGILVWLPILQLFPLLRAAGMSRWWFLACLVPVLNVLPSIIWVVKIVQARGKNGLLVLFLLLPMTNILAFLYLAFSDSAPPPEKSQKKSEKRVEIMTLETA